jgi:hypothetical protein
LQRADRKAIERQTKIREKGLLAGGSDALEAGVSFARLPYELLVCKLNRPEANLLTAKSFPSMLVSGQERTTYF